MRLTLRRKLVIIYSLIYSLTAIITSALSFYYIVKNYSIILANSISIPVIDNNDYIKNKILELESSIFKFEIVNIGPIKKYKRYENLSNNNYISPKLKLLLEREKKNEIHSKRTERIARRKEAEKRGEVVISREKKPYPNFPFPMLAHPYPGKEKLVKYPCYVQPKLDGIRAIAIGNELYSRNGFPFPTFDHVKAELPKNTEKLILDGELYTNEIPFEELSGLTKRVNYVEIKKIS